MTRKLRPFKAEKLTSRTIFHGNSSEDPANRGWRFMSATSVPGQDRS